MTEPRNVRLTLAFDGGAYRGWQVQRDAPTVQGTVLEAIRRITGEKTSLVGSGRTDAGTHARALVANFRTRSSIRPRDLLKALNSLLPEDIRVLSARAAPPEFHAQRSARSKTYRYQIYRGPVLPPHLAREYYHYPHPLALEPMIAAAALFIGSHDFRSFAKTGSEAERAPRGTVRTVLRSSLAAAGRRLIYTVEADGFLHHMVRNIVGTLVEVGRGRMTIEEVDELFDRRDRSLAGATVPARGLILVKVQYAPEARSSNTDATPA
jgi:tRNA pseudouridine38-40 synthase